MARVLVVEGGDDQRVAPVLAMEGLAVMTTECGQGVSAAVERYAPNLIVLELARVDSNAVRLCQRVRTFTNVPLVVVSKPCSEREAISVFAAGVDTIMPDSVGPHELAARVRAQLRRAPKEERPTAHAVRVGEIVLDPASRELRVNGTLVVLPRREFDIAEMLMRKAGRVVTRDELIHEFWGTRRDTKTLDVQVGRLRARLAKIEGYRRIVTVRGVGYRLLLDAELEQDTGPEVVIDLRPIVRPAGGEGLDALGDVGTDLVDETPAGTATC
jgi:DNA-binding response OmpR family regulator